MRWNRFSYFLGILFTLLLLISCDIKPPVTVAYRDSWWGDKKGKVIRVTSTSDKYLHGISVSIEKPTGEKFGVVIDTLEPHKTKEIGWVEIRAKIINSGDKISISIDGYLLDYGPITISFD